MRQVGTAAFMPVIFIAALLRWRPGARPPPSQGQRPTRLTSGDLRRTYRLLYQLGATPWDDGRVPDAVVAAAGGWPGQPARILLFLGLLKEATEPVAHGANQRPLASAVVQPAVAQILAGDDPVLAAALSYSPGPVVIADC